MLCFFLYSHYTLHCIVGFEQLCIRCGAGWVRWGDALATGATATEAPARASQHRGLL